MEFFKSTGDVSNGWIDPASRGVGEKADFLEMRRGVRKRRRIRKAGAPFQDQLFGRREWRGISHFAERIEEIQRRRDGAGAGRVPAAIGSLAFDLEQSGQPAARLGPMIGSP